MKLKTNHLPNLPGVYIFEDKHKKPIYIGKSVNIKTRVKQHLRQAPFISQSKKINFITTPNDIVAILLEAELIKLYAPKYNITQKDNKSAPYIVITNPPTPRILIVRGQDLILSDFRYPNRQIFGPFLNKTQVFKILKSLKNIFGYCQKPFNSLKQTCFYYQIHACPGACVAKITPTEYQQHLKLIKNFLSGRVNFLKKNLIKKIKIASKKQDFEAANEFKTILTGLEYVLNTHQTSQFFALPNENKILMEKIVTTLKHPLLKSSPKRIECYDAAHLQTSHYTGSMAVVTNGLLDSNQYRLFKIKTKPQGDPQALKEILSRRLAHTDWPYPDLIILDGGVGQLSVVFPIIPETIATIALSKHRETIHYYNDKGRLVNLNLALSNPVLSLFRLMRDESHRLATTLHRKSRKESLLGRCFSSDGDCVPTRAPPR